MEMVDDGFDLSTGVPIAQTNRTWVAGTDGMEQIARVRVGLIGIIMDGVAAVRVIRTTVHDIGEERKIVVVEAAETLYIGGIKVEHIGTSCIRNGLGLEVKHFATATL